VSFAIDANILLYASDTSSPFSRRALQFLGECLSGSEIFCLAWITVMSYLRIATHPAIFDRPLTPDEAMRNVEALLDAPHARFLAEEDEVRQVYRETTRGVPTRGNFVPNAHLAALLRQQGVGTLYTRDRDFLKFGFLDVRDPLADGRR
jgi:hypothetical protein